MRKKHRLKTSFLTMAMVTGCAVAQPGATEKMTFEVASVRPAAPGAPPPAALRGANNEGRLTIRDRSLQRLLLQAFGLSFGLREVQLAAPGWLENQKFDIVAKIPPGSSSDQVNTMLLNLLIERFALRFHRETRELPGFALVVAKGGVKMRESGSPTGPHAAPEAPANGNGPGVMMTTKDNDGLPQLPPGRKGALIMSLNGYTRRTARVQTMTEIAQFCESVLHIRVVDKTGLTATYDYNLNFTTGEQAGSAADGDAPPPLQVAIETLGLKLEAKKLPIDVL
jgi:uncharacterized protein (TIGR03435 family)